MDSYSFAGRTFAADPDGTLEWVWRYGRVFARAWTRVHVVGLEHLPRAGPVIVAANHRSHADIPAIVGAFWRRVVFIATDDLWGFPVMRFVLDSQRCPRVHHDGADKQALVDALEMLRLDRVLGVFPEGGLRPEGPTPFEDGAAYLAVRSGAPLVPLGIAGTRDAWRHKEWPPLRSRQVCMTIGPPLFPDRSLKRRDAVHDLGARLEAEVRHLTAMAERIRNDALGT